MKKIIGLALLAAMLTLTGCQRQSDKVSYNLSLEADSFNVVRQLTVINCRSDDVLFQMTGKMSIETDSADGQLEIVVQDEKGIYHKHFVYLNDWVTYVVEDIGGADVSEYHYSLNYNPKMWIPVLPDYVD